VTSRLAISNSSLHCDLKGMVAILNSDTGLFYNLNESGAILWQHLNEPRTVEELAEILAQKYGLKPEGSRKDTEAIVEQMLSAGILQVVGDVD